MNRRNFLLTSFSLPFVSVGVLSANSVIPEQDTFILTFDNKMTFEMALSGMSYRSVETKKVLEDRAIYLSDGKIETFLTHDKIEKDLFGVERILPMAVAFAASKIENGTTGEILKNRYG